MSEQEQGATPGQVADTPEPAQVPETVEAGTTEQQAAETDGQQQEKPISDEQKARRARDRLQRRFGELTAKLDQKDRQIEQLLSVVQQNTPGQARAGQPAGEQDGPPQRDAFPDWEAYQEAKTEWKARQVTRHELQADRQQTYEQQTRYQQEQAAYNAVQSFAQRQDAFAKVVPDYYEALDNSNAQLPDGIESLFVEVPDSYIAAYAIAKNPELASQFWGKSRSQAAAVLGSIVASYKARPNPQVSTAPPPGKPVSARGAPASSTPSDNESVDEWIRKRNAEINKRGG